MAADFLSLIGAIPGLMSAFGGDQSAPYRKQQEQLASRQNQISQALTDNNNPLYQQIYGQYKQQNQNNMASMIAEAQGQNRMNASMGRVPLFNQERGGENIFRAMMQQGQNAGVQADQQARQALMQASQGAASGLGAYNSISPFAARAAAQKQMGGYQGIEDLLRGMTQQQRPSQLGQNIQWNQPQQAQQMYNPGQPNTVRGSYGY